jgi:type VI secretion system secreted protein VgrG
MCIPRIGQEVIISFLEGDPDQPIIIGRVYNADQMPPFTLPGKKTVSGIKSNSTPGGGGSNELHLDDTKGSESVYLHAQKDYTTDVENNMTTTVKVDQTNTVKGKQTETITGDQTLTVTSGNQTVSVDSGNQTITVKSGAQTIAVDSGGASLTAKTNRDVKVPAGPYSVTAKSDVSLTSETATLSGTAKGNVTMKSETADIFVLAPASRAVVEAPTIELKGTQKIVLVVGASSIEMTPAEVKIKSPKITSEADGDHTIKGGTIKLN